MPSPKFSHWSQPFPLSLSDAHDSHHLSSFLAFWGSCEDVQSDTLQCGVHCPVTSLARGPPAGGLSVAHAHEAQLGPVRARATFFV